MAEFNAAAAPKSAIAFNSSLLSMPPLPEPTVLSTILGTEGRAEPTNHMHLSATMPRQLIPVHPHLFSKTGPIKREDARLLVDPDHANDEEVINAKLRQMQTFQKNYNARARIALEAEIVKFCRACKLTTTGDEHAPLVSNMKDIVARALLRRGDGTLWCDDSSVGKILGVMFDSMPNHARETHATLILNDMGYTYQATSSSADSFGKRLISAKRAEMKKGYEKIVKRHKKKISAAHALIAQSNQPNAQPTNQPPRVTALRGTTSNDVASTPTSWQNALHNVSQSTAALTSTTTATISPTTAPTDSGSVPTTTTLDLLADAALVSPAGQLTSFARTTSTATVPGPAADLEDAPTMRPTTTSLTDLPPPSIGVELLATGFVGNKATSGTCTSNSATAAASAAGQKSKQVSSSAPTAGPTQQSGRAEVLATARSRHPQQQQKKKKKKSKVSRKSTATSTKTNKRTKTAAKIIVNETPKLKDSDKCQCPMTNYVEVTIYDAANDDRIKGNNAVCKYKGKNCVGTLEPTIDSPVFVCNKYWNRESYHTYGSFMCMCSHICHKCNKEKGRLSRKKQYN